MIIATHDGQYHADDLLATVLLRRIFPVVSVLRTRNVDELGTADIVYDVGSVYNPTERRFDHHQLGFAETFHGTLLSSAGLIFREYWPKLVGNEAQADLLYDNFVRGVDEHDNGVAFNDGSFYFEKRYLLGFSFEESCAEMEKLFQLELDFAVRLFFDYYIIRQAVYTAKEHGERFVWLPSGVNYSSCLPDLNKDQSIRFVASEKNGYFRVASVPIKAKSFENLQYLPVEWAGLRGAELDAATGISGGVFVHRCRFLGIWDSKDAADKALDILLAEAQNRGSSAECLPHE